MFKKAYMIGAVILGFSIIGQPTVAVSQTSSFIKKSPKKTIPGMTLRGIDQVTCPQNTRQNVQFIIQSDGKNVAGGKITIRKINPDAFFTTISRPAATFGGLYTARSLCPGTYSAGILGDGEGGLIKSKNLYYQTINKRFTVPGNSRVVINLVKRMTRITLRRVNDKFPNHRFSGTSGYKRPEPASGVADFKIRDNGAVVTANVHCCQSYTFEDRGSKTHITPQGKLIRTRIDGNIDQKWYYIPTFFMPNIRGLKLTPPFNGKPTSDFKDEWGLKFDYLTERTNKRYEDNIVSGQSIAYRQRVQYGMPIIITVYKYRP